MDWVAVGTLIGQVGVPAALLLGIGLAAWKSIKWGGTNIIIPFVKTHVSLMEEVVANLREQTAYLESLDRKLTDHDKKADTIMLDVQELKRQVTAQ